MKGGKFFPLIFGSESRAKYTYDLV